MKAGIYHGLHDVSVEEIEKPKLIPGSIVIRNVRAGICGTDLHAYGLEYEGVCIYPGNQFGHEMVGIVDKVADGVSEFEEGDFVFVNPCTFKDPTPERGTLANCDMAGAFSQYVRVDRPRESYNVFKLDPSLSPDVAALIEPVSVALNGIEIASPKPGDKVLIYGGGIIGMCALACLGCLGFNDVVVTARNDFRCGKVKELGGVLCDTREQTIPEFVIGRWSRLTGNSSEETWNADLVIDCGGWKGCIEEMMRYAKAGSAISELSLGISEERITASQLACKAIRIFGSFAYTPEVNSRAIAMISENPDRFAPIVTSVFGLSRLPEAFEAASDSHQNVKVLIDHAR